MLKDNKAHSPYVARYEDLPVINVLMILCVHNIVRHTYVRLYILHGHYRNPSPRLDTWVIPGQINTKNGATSQILAKLGEHIHYHKLLFDIKF